MAHVLTVLFDGAAVCRVERTEVPCEKRPSLQLTPHGGVLTFVDSRGGQTTFDLAGVYEEGARFVHLSIRISPTLAVQTDCLLGAAPEPPVGAFAQGKIKAIRFQPILLPESTRPASSLIGRGLMFRGLQYPGAVTPGHVSLMGICDACGKSFRMQAFHAGEAGLTYLYCSKGPHTLVASAHEPDAPPTGAAADPAAVARFEAGLPPCRTCGGTFRHANAFRCPHCGVPYLNYERFAEDRQRDTYGVYLYGASCQEFPSGLLVTPGLVPKARWPRP